MRIKKLTSILLAATLTLGLVACGGKSDTQAILQEIVKTIR